jgi:hypothetical protein
MLAGGFLKLCDTIKNLCHADRMRECAQVRICRLWIEVVTQIEQRVFALDSQLEYFFKV